MVKYHEFLCGGRGFQECEKWEGYFFGGKPWKKADAPDFNKDHLRRQKLEKKYISGNANLSEDTDEEKSEEDIDRVSEVKSLPSM